MRFDWIPLSASALVIGAMALVFATVMNPVVDGTSAQTLEAASADPERWLAMAVMFTLTSVALTVGLPSVLVLLQSGGRLTGLVGVLVLTVGAICTCGYAVLMIFFRALVVTGTVTAADLDQVTDDRGLSLFLTVWVGSFYGGLLLIAIALLLAGTTQRWVPLVMVLFVLGGPFSEQLGRSGAAAQSMLLAAAMTGVATAAVASSRAVARRPALVG